MAGLSTVALLQNKAKNPSFEVFLVAHGYAAVHDLRYEPGFGLTRLPLLKFLLVIAALT